MLLTHTHRLHTTTLLQRRILANDAFLVLLLPAIPVRVVTLPIQVTSTTSGLANGLTLPLLRAPLLLALLLALLLLFLLLLLKLPCKEFHLLGAVVIAPALDRHYRHLHRHWFRLLRP